jgi:DNA polymerase III alpha subunit
MVRAGAFDAFGTRKGLVGLKSPGMLFDVEEWDALTKGREEAEALGFWLTVDPFEVFAERFKASGCMSPKVVRRAAPRAAVIVGGMVEKITSSRTSIGEIGNIDLFHPEGSLRVTLWPNTWAHYKGEFSAGEMVVAFGQKGSSEDQVTIDRDRGGQMKEV